MKSFYSKYRILFILVFLFAFISLVDVVVLSGSFKGIENYKHLIYMAFLVGGVILLLTQIIKEDDEKNGS
ncbi:MAG: hypothetical protein P8O94_03535 [Flavobacteriaceae bacterium]|jgi:hypothetical protein|nr:hypothetical protein [Flavobacteriaceae bacterium]MDC1279372.1 hypothetical protein [bacterium]MDB4153332.1 hypothetical protein [Flavobacteriaceae bacterium]MDB9988458.1 hypothetical protein [Flavobacteriaceae bacterium]MDC1439069.1 hypothetical protein [Flavobacteriaceae bacterium]|tara:strand:- start:18 stop:227 length:210 start_codon:yes stop_codon:yes gene_type:complete